jgi:gliding motility-associated-like protein
LWDFGDGNGGIGPDINHNYSIAGDYTLTLFLSNFCLTDTVQTSINLGQGPELSIAVSENQVCENSEVSVVNLSPTGVDFQWYINGVPEANYLSTINIAGAENGVNVVQLTAINPVNNCPSSVQSNFEVFPRPNISIIASPDTGCYPLTVSILNQTTGANAWEWIFANGTGSSSQEPAFVINDTGEFPIQLIAHNYVSFLLDCPDTATISVLVHPKPVSNFSLSALEGCGPPDTVFVTNQSTGVLENIWQWEQNLSNETAPVIAFSDTGFKWISLKVVNEFACADSSSKGYRVYGQPELAFSIEPENGCPPLNVNFINKTIYSDSVIWLFGDGSLSNLYSPNHVYTNSGNYTVSLTASTGNGLCTADTTLFQFIEVYPKAFSAFSVNPLSINQDSPVINLINESSDYIALSLFIDSVLVSQSLPSNYIFTDPDSGFHQLMLIANNSFNCPDTSYNKIYIKAKPQYYLPNSFSPNGDGINDRFKIYFERAPEVFWVNIYNRWGELIYTSTDPDEGWDGTYMNTGKRIVQDEVYVLKFSALIEGTLLISRLFVNITILK